MLLEGNKSPIVIACIVGLAGLLLDDEPFRVTRPTANLGIHVIFPIASSWEPPLSILKLTSSDIAWEWLPLPLLQLHQQVIGFLRGSPLGSLYGRNRGLLGAGACRRQFLRARLFRCMGTGSVGQTSK